MVSRVEREIHSIRRDQVERIPHHWGLKAIAGAAFGALCFGMGFALKGLLLNVTQRFPPNQLWYILAAIIIILTAEISFIGYSHVSDKKRRPFGQFWFKRITTYVFVGFGVSIFLFYVFGLNQLTVSDAHVLNTIVALALPCCVGASVADLLKQY